MGKTQTSNDTQPEAAPVANAPTNGATSEGQQQPNEIAKGMGNVEARNRATESLHNMLGISEQDASNANLAQILTGQQDPQPPTPAPTSEAAPETAPNAADSQETSAQKPPVQESDDGESYVVSKDAWDFMMSIANQAVGGTSPAPESGSLPSQTPPSQQVPQAPPAAAPPEPMQVPELNIKYPTPDELSDMMAEPEKMGKWLQDHDREVVTQVTSTLLQNVAPYIYMHMLNGFTPLHLAHKLMDENPDVPENIAYYASLQIAQEHPEFTPRQRAQELQKRLNWAKSNVEKAAQSKGAPKPRFARNKTTAASGTPPADDESKNDMAEHVRRLLKMNEIRASGLEIR